MRNPLLTAAALVLAALLSGPAHATCTGEEAGQKARAFYDALQDLADNDPENFEKIKKEADQELEQLERQPPEDDVEAVCNFFDTMLRRIEQLDALPPRR